eukprot:1854853-Lingulodinium_polyedra.AAC.1
MQLRNLDRSARCAVDARIGSGRCTHVAADRERHWEPRQPAKSADCAADPVGGHRRSPGRAGRRNHAEVFEAGARRDAPAARAEPGTQLGAVRPQPALGRVQLPVHVALKLPRGVQCG